MKVFDIIVTVSRMRYKQKMKDETNGILIKEFVGLRPKMYSLVEENNSEKKTPKGLNC